MNIFEVNTAFNIIWSKGYDVKITKTEIRVFSTEYDEMLDLDIYNSIVKLPHGGDIIGTLYQALGQSVKLLENV